MRAFPAFDMLINNTKQVFIFSSSGLIDARRHLVGISPLMPTRPYKCTLIANYLLNPMSLPHSNINDTVYYVH